MASQGIPTPSSLSPTGDVHLDAYGSPMQLRDSGVTVVCYGVLAHLHRSRLIKGPISGWDVTTCIPVTLLSVGAEEEEEEEKIGSSSYRFSRRAF